jgi:fructokinase
MITVFGEALVTLVPTSDETVVRALPGGSAFNIALGAARQGFPTALMARFSRDGFGQILRRFAVRSGVDLSAAPEADEPTAIALMPAARTGNNPHGSLYIEGTASREWSSAELALIPAATAVLHIGSAVHWPAPVRARIVRLADRLRHGGVLVSIDLNIRPEITQALGETPGQSRLLLDRLLRSADVIRASIEDIGWLYPGRAPHAVAESWLNLGPALIVIDAGGSGVLVLHGPGFALHRPPYRRGVAERAIGAGRVNGASRICAADALTAGLLGALYQLKLEARSIRRLPAEDLTEVLDSAI